MRRRTKSCASAKPPAAAAAAPVPTPPEAPPLTAGLRAEALAAECRLMARVSERCGEALTLACRTSSVPREFLAALVANESGGDPNALRFEPEVYRHLEGVAAGFSPVYAGLGFQDLFQEAEEILHPKADAFHQQALRVLEGGGNLLQGISEEALRELATSWGYTQIMGYHMVGRRGTPRDLLLPERNFQVALELLAEFAEEFQLDLRREFAELFRCWNTGRPDGRTTDPRYVEKGLCRMEIDRALQAELVPAGVAAS